MTASEGKKSTFNWGSRGRPTEQGPEYEFEQIIAENFPNLVGETGIQIQEIERFPLKSIKTFKYLNI